MGNSEILSATDANNAPPRRIRWTPALVERFWQGFSQTRLVEHSFSRQGGRSLIIAVDHLLPRSGEVLDYGAGDGDLVQMMCERGLKASAYEPSEKRSETLRKRLEKYPNFLEIIKQETKKCFDVVIAAEVIEHMLDEQIDLSLRRIHSFVRPGGLLIVTAPNNEDLDLGMAYCPISNTLFHRWQHVRSFTDRTLADLLSQYGFVEIASHHVEFNDTLFVPYDLFWGSDADTNNMPSHIVELRANRPVRMGAENNLLYIGRRKI